MAQQEGGVMELALVLAVIFCSAGILYWLMMRWVQVDDRKLGCRAGVEGAGAVPDPPVSTSDGPVSERRRPCA
jgi:hypothetical protein